MSDQPSRHSLSDLDLPISEAGEGRPALVLHGGGGPGSVAPLSRRLAQQARVYTPTHPGWDGTELPAWLHSVPQLTTLYLELLEARDLRDVLVVGSSMGGWLAADLATRDDQHRISAIALIDAGGIEVPEEPARDFFSLDARGLADYAYYDGDRFYVDPATVPPEKAARQRANVASLRVLTGDAGMHDPGLRSRLSGIQVPALVLWGAADRIMTPAYGKAFADAIPGARFEVIPKAGHLPYLEQPEATFQALEDFMRSSRTGFQVAARPS